VISSRRRRAEYGACSGDRKDAYRVLVGKPEIKRGLRRPRHRWEEVNIKTDLQEAGWGAWN
jgi:hypothetical protein